MANVEKAISELVDVVSHLVRTHVRWNQDLDHDLALAKLESAKVHAAAGGLETAVGAVADGVKAVVDGDLIGAVTDATTAVDGVRVITNAVKEAVNEANA